MGTIFFFFLLRAMEGSLVRGQSLWYLGLMYVKSAQYDKAESTFKDITGQEYHYKKEEAAALLESLR
jgi:hypothetical protein